jgi:hypothetical protein
MAKKKAVSQKPVSEPTQEAADDSAKTATADSPMPTKSKPKASDEQSTDGGVGIADIKKAVAFSNSVGGLEKAIALLQILKVAKDVQ